MDILTQGAVGAAAAQAFNRNPEHVRIAALCGLLAGLAPDLDVLIRSETDPLLYLQYHRHFTHSLAFVPIGGAIVAGLVYMLTRGGRDITFSRLWIFSALGMATHGLLDAMTSYGTSLLWPFSDTRISWSLVSVIDPLITVPLLVFLTIAIIRRVSCYARYALMWTIAYMAFASFQHHRALDIAHSLAAMREQAPVRIEVKPSFANTLVWRVITELPDKFHVDAIRVGISAQAFPGTSIRKLDLQRDLPWVGSGTQQAKDIDRFAFFSDGFIAQDPLHPERILDIRYAFLPNEINALWSIELSANATDTSHARYLTHREDPQKNLGKLWQMLKGNTD